MRANKTIWIVGFLSVFLVAGGLFAQSKMMTPKVQIAVLLDTSNSMDGLIAQAKTQLWKIVNEFISAKKSGLRPDIQVALLEYGNDRLPGSEGHIRVVQALTTDLDKVSEELFALKTNGGQEYCGQVIQVATRVLDWSTNPGDLKVIVIAGNEPFTQGKVDYKKSCKEAIAKGIMINTIFCGPFQKGVATHWKDGSLLADGSYLNIDQNRRVAHIAAPQDAEISRLGGELNKTYIGYGARGKAAKRRQAAQDSNAQGAGSGVMSQRAVFKSSAAYSNSNWDLADAVKKKKVNLEELEKEALPEEMRSMEVKERKAYVARKGKKRAEIQAKIRKLNAERKKYLAKKKKEQAESKGDTLDSAMIKSLRRQAEKKSFEFGPN
jgi:hypothetical protein